MPGTACIVGDHALEGAGQRRPRARPPPSCRPRSRGRSAPRARPRRCAAPSSGRRGRRRAAARTRTPRRPPPCPRRPSRRRPRRGRGARGRRPRSRGCASTRPRRRAAARPATAPRCGDPAHGVEAVGERRRSRRRRGAGGSGAGWAWSQARVMTPSVPSDPTKTWLRSGPDGLAGLPAGADHAAVGEDDLEARRRCPRSCRSGSTAGPAPRQAIQPPTVDSAIDCGQWPTVSSWRGGQLGLEARRRTCRPAPRRPARPGRPTRCPTCPQRSSTRPPCTGTAPPTTLLRPPAAVTGMRARSHVASSAETCSVVVGRATANGPGADLAGGGPHHGERPPVPAGLAELGGVGGDVGAARTAARRARRRGCRPGVPRGAARAPPGPPAISIGGGGGARLGLHTSTSSGERSTADRAR